MYLSDYHLHTQLSTDSLATLEGHMQRAYEQGIREICVTDHWNLADQSGNLLPNTYDWEAVSANILAVRNQFFGKVDIRMGVEIGNGILDPKACEAVLADERVDFAIGSLHSASEDMSRIGIFTQAHACRSMRDCAELVQDYMNILQKTADSEHYDVLGHIIYPMRYFPAQFDVSLKPYWEQLAETLRTVIAKGKGIEMNTNRGQDIKAWADVLKLYHDLGGEIITTGSDAHAESDLGGGIAQAQDLLNSIGFRYTSVYRHHVPFFTAL